jgi:hypothetical protein
LTIVDVNAKICIERSISRRKEEVGMNRVGYISLPEAARQLGITTGTLHYYLRRLGITSKKFDLDKKRYLIVADFERIRTLKLAASSVDEDASAALACGVA